MGLVAVGGGWLSAPRLSHDPEDSTSGKATATPTNQARRFLTQCDRERIPVTALDVLAAQGAITGIVDYYPERGRESSLRGKGARVAHHRMEAE